MAGIGEQITVTCACGARLNAPLSAVGKTAPCPKCGSPLTVPPPFEADFGAAPEQFDYSMGKGVLYACIAGVIAAAVSTAIAIVVEGEISIVAVGIGFACGIGMLMGTKRRAPEVGILAAGITAGAILLSKIAIFLILVSSSASESVDQVTRSGPPDELVRVMLTDEILAEHEDDEDFSLDDAATIASERQAAMTPQQQETYLKTRRAALSQQAAQQARSEAGLLDFALVMFGMYDIIFFVGALAAAYFVSTFNDT